jgi:hypothetical protein
MLKIIGLAVLLLVVAVVVYAATRPDNFRVERRLRIHAPAAAIFPLVNDLHRHLEWSPWEKKDPAMARTYTGAPSGKGQIYEWDGNSDIGKGRMEIVESVEPQKVVFSMHFIAPMEAHNTGEFLLVPDGDSTDVTWAMYGPQPFVGKLMSVFFSIDNMVGREFESGLARLKALTEAKS